MPLPKPLLRIKTNVHKNDFGHVLVVAGSSSMLGAAALTALAAMRSGAGLVTAAVAQSLNLTLQKKISPIIMTWPLAETSKQTISHKAAAEILKKLDRFNVLALGPGLSQEENTQRFVIELIKKSPKPLVIDADALNALATKINALKALSTLKVLTPHPGEMARLTGLTTAIIEKNRTKIAQSFARQYNCFLVLKGHRTVVAGPSGQTCINTTGNSAMAKAGTGDVLTGIIAAFLAQGIEPFAAVKWAVYIHGKSGDLARRTHAPASVIATDLIDAIPKALKSCRR